MLSQSSKFRRDEAGTDTSRARARQGEHVMSHMRDKRFPIDMEDLNLSTLTGKRFPMRPPGCRVGCSLEFKLQIC